MSQLTPIEQDMSPESREVTRIAWENSVWFADVDDTLIDTISAAEYGTEGVREALVAHYGEAKATEIQTNFSAMFRLMFDGYRVKHDEGWQKVVGGKEAFDSLLETVASLQAQVKENYGHVKKWSREVFIKLAADEAGVEITPELVHEATDAYWINLTEHIEIFPDALELADTIAEHGRPLYLVTSSDARLTM